MKNLRPDFNDSLRPEYRRSDFGKMVRGGYAPTQVEFAELVSLLMACIGEDEGVTLTKQSINNSPGSQGDWTYEINEGNQITLRYWNTEFGSLQESITYPTSISTYQQMSDLKTLIQEHFRSLQLKARAS